ncbi:hypothetical protein AMK59_5280, partial [Oryctes borbonicus]
MNISRLSKILHQISNSGEKILTSEQNLFKNKNRWIGILAKISEDNENLEIKRNKIIDKFPLVWLRDNCTCENCFHKSSQSRIINWKEFDVDVKVRSIEAIDENNIVINWNDDHKSVYPLNWLESRSFSKVHQEKFLNGVCTPAKHLWSKNEFLDILKDYE